MLLAIDPGADSGWAIFIDGRLSNCGLWSTGTPKGEYTRPSILVFDEVLIESPRLRPRGEKNPNAILLLARRAGEWGGRYASSPVKYITPNEWKKSTPDVISTQRTKNALDVDESRIVEWVFSRLPGKKGLAESRRHNVYDAIGIGLWAVKRGWK